MSVFILAFLLAFVVIVCVLSGCAQIREFVSELMRTEPKPGRKHPGPDYKFNRTWVYKEGEKEKKPDPRTAEQLAVAAARAKMAAEDAARYTHLLVRFIELVPSILEATSNGTGVAFANFLPEILDRGIKDRDDYQFVEESVHVDEGGLTLSAKAYADLCFTSTPPEPLIRDHLHYGYLTDINAYYVVMNGLFPIYSDDNICRFYQIDLALLGERRVPVRIESIIGIFKSEKPLTDEAWVLDMKKADNSKPTPPTVLELKGSNVNYSPAMRALFHFLLKAFDDPIGIRFIEVNVQQSRQSNDGKESVTRVVRTSDSHVMMLEEVFGEEFIIEDEAEDFNIKDEA